MYGTFMLRFYLLAALVILGRGERTSSEHDVLGTDSGGLEQDLSKDGERVIQKSKRASSQPGVLSADSGGLQQEAKRENSTRAWTAALHTVAWKAAVNAYINSACANFGKSAGRAPLKDGCEDVAALDAAGGPSVFAWHCQGYGLIMGIRGTDLGPKGDCVGSDLLADHDLFDLPHIASAGKAKGEDSGTGAAYVEAVQGFIRKVGAPNMLAGHSLGAGLAVKMGQLEEVDPRNVYAFAPPPLTDEEFKGQNVMYNTQDPVFAAVKARGGAPGCEFDGAGHDDCPTCHAVVTNGGYDAGPLNVIWDDSAECSNCWHASHELGPYGPKDNPCSA